jgi:hypothetical protein
MSSARTKRTMPKDSKLALQTSKSRTAATGKRSPLHSISAHSKSFGSDLQGAFKKNVGKARRDNKRILGSPDIAPRT